MAMCEGCTDGQHWNCGMQTWCKCECAGPDGDYSNEIDPYEGLTMVCGAYRFANLGPRCYQPEGHKLPHIFECEGTVDDN